MRRHLDAGIAVARTQEALALTLRLAMDWVRLSPDQGQRRDATALLSETYASCVEGFDWPDLCDAKALLGGAP